MTATKVGLVSYADDPLSRVFRIVYPTDNDSELDDPRWVTEGVDPARVAVLTRVEPGSDAVQFGGTPWTAADEPLPLPVVDPVAEVIP